MDAIAYAKVAEAMNALGIEDQNHVTQIIIDPKWVTVQRHALRDGRPYLDDNGGGVALTADFFEVEYA